MTDEKTILSNIQEAEEQALSVFSDKWETGLRNSEIYGLKHYTSEEEKAITSKKRYPYKIDSISHSINTLLGTQRNARFDIFFNAREQGDEIRCELYNAVWKYFADLYDFEHVESDVFQDAIVSTYGVFGTYLDKTRTVTGDIKVCRVPFDEVLWDTNFRQYNLEDAGWMSRFKYYRRGALISLHPEQKDLLLKIGTEKRWGGAKDLKETYIKKEQDIIAVHEFYERSYKNIYLVSVGGQLGVIHSAYRTEDEAVAEIRKATELFNSGQLAGQIDPSETMPVMKPESYSVSTIMKTEAVLNAILTETEEFPMGMFPYKPFFCYFHDGEFWSVVDRLKDPQTFLNRMFIQADHWIGTMAKGSLWIDPRTDAKDKKKIEESWGSTGGIVSTKYEPKPLNSPGPAPQLFSMMDRVQINMTDSMGGANQMGSKQTASESGRAVLARLQQAGLDHFVPMDNMRRTKHELGMDIAWRLANEITAPRVLRIIGDKLTMQTMAKGGVEQFFSKNEQKPNVGYLEVNTSPENSLEGLEVDIIVDEAGHSPTKNSATLNTLGDLGKAGVLTIPPPPEVVIELSDLPQSLKEVWLQSIEAAKAESKEPLVKNVAVNYKDLPVDAKMDVLKQMGLSSNVMAVATKELTDKPHLSTINEPKLTEKEQNMGKA